MDLRTDDMGKIRVLIVDDSVVIRRLLTNILSAEPDMEVVGAAADGAIALAKIPQVNPDVITLDVEMPGKDGLETLDDIRASYPSLPVMMFSALTERAAAITLEAIARGATDYVTKPSGTGSREASIEHVRRQLVPKLRGLANRGLSTRPPVPRKPSPPAAPKAAPGFKVTPEVLVIGASTGGPTALSTVLSALPASLRVPVLIVQHMPPVFTKMFAERLTTACPLRVKEATAGDRLISGQVLVAPGDYHMRLYRDGISTRIVLDQSEPENSCRPAVDVLFRSAAAVFGPATLAVVLTGMGTDGVRGCELVREHGGSVIVQDAATSVVWGMPGLVAKAGLANAVLPLAEIGRELTQRIAAYPGGDRVAESRHVH
ncbi:MAG: chemotaxis response regulator protein-glutamate methylesterase [Polyangiaceae bacterium]